MKKLSKKQSVAIASLINTVVVWAGIGAKAIAENDHDTLRLALRNEAEATVALADIHGIELPNLHNARELHTNR